MMSVLFKNATGKYFLFAKGADEVMIPKLVAHCQKEKSTLQAVQEFAT